ncbi:hypothetical protein MASR1M31_18610 [Porphyromonadaceae bacterium]
MEELTADMDFRTKTSRKHAGGCIETSNRTWLFCGQDMPSHDYSAPRGHMYTIEDVRNTLRNRTPDEHTHDMQPATCWA